MSPRAPKAPPVEPAADPLADLRGPEGDETPAAPPAPGEPVPESPVRTLIGEAVGEASTCWDNLSGAGVFESERASGIVDRTVAALADMGALVSADETERLAVIIAAWHADPTSVGFLHRGGVCGCHYLGKLSLAAATPAAGE